VHRWLLDPGSIDKSTAARLADPSIQHRRVARATEIGKHWPELPVARKRAVLTTLIERNRRWRPAGDVSDHPASAASRAGPEAMSIRSGPYVDPFDQGGEDSALAGHGQLGPVLADLCGPRDTPVLY